MLSHSQRPTARSLELAHSDRDQSLCLYDDVLISIENTDPSVQYFARTLELLQAIRTRHEAGAGLLVIIRRDAKPPNEAARSFLTQNLSAFAACVCAFAHVIEGEGFIASAKRSVLTLIFAARRDRFPIRIFKDATDGARWLFQQLDKSDEDLRQFLPLVLAQREKQFSAIPLSE